MEQLTVRKALELEVFRRTEVTVHAGRENLDRPIRWVHTGEIPDIHRFLTGQEMLLTAGLGMGATEEQQRAFIRRVAEAQASVLVVELAGRMFDTMPQAAIDEAQAVGLPLIGLRDEIPFVEASAQVHEVLVEVRTAQLVADEAVGQAFTNLLLSGQDYLSVVDEAARLTGFPVVLEDVAHQMRAYTGGDPESDRVVGHWDRHSRAVHEQYPLPAPRRRDVAASIDGSSGEVVACVRRPVVLRGETWGWMHLLHVAAAPLPSALSALDRAAAAVAISLLSERESGARAAQRQGALLNRLLLGDITGEEFVHGALSLGHDLRHRQLVVVVAAPDETTEDGSGSRLLADTVNGLGLVAVVSDVGDAALGVVAVDGKGADDRLAADLSERGYSGGLSRIVAPATLPTAVRQARSAASAATATNARKVLHFNDLGALRLLVALADGPELARYVEDELGPLLQHDALSANPLLPTLRAFLEAGGNKARTAQELFVQRRTLYYRLERITRSLGLDINNSEVQQRLQLAVRGHDLLRHSAARRR